MTSPSGITGPPDWKAPRVLGPLSKCCFVAFSLLSVNQKSDVVISIFSLSSVYTDQRAMNNSIKV